VSLQADRRHGDSTEMLTSLERLSDRLIELTTIEVQCSAAGRTEPPASVGVR